jgi:alkanesulfonate monooxygenase SsuD/methylene tetrahydromethanopterin reductase-like flavin-dependent oxidoreductase (luciferase family)
MRIGLQIPTMFREGKQVSEALGDLVERTDQAGFDSLWVMDHFLLKLSPERLSAGRTTTTGGSLQTPDGEIRELLEAWSTLAFAAARTKQVKLGTLVTGITYRYPGVLVEIANSCKKYGQLFHAHISCFNLRPLKSLSKPKGSTGREAQLR